MIRRSAGLSAAERLRAVRLARSGDASGFGELLRVEWPPVLVAFDRPCLPVTDFPDIHWQKERPREAAD